MQQTLAKSLHDKLRYLVIGIVCAVILIVGRLVHLQIHLMDYLFTQSQKNFLRIEKVVPPRGNIVDCNGTLLVTNRPVINVYWQGTGKSKLDATDVALLDYLAIITDHPINAEVINSIKQAERLYKKILIASDISFEQISKLEEQFPQHPNIKLANHFERFYPYGNYASHILGYLSYINLEPTGSMGLEKLFEDTLKGQPGSLLRTINSLGRNLNEVEIKKALAGQTIQTTLDIELQSIVEKIFPPDQSGAFIIMDPSNGSIVSLVSRPNFDPSLFLHPMSDQDWHELQDNRPFINRAFNACYPPGSFFKLVSMSALLEHNFIAPDATIYCGGFSTFCDGQYYCHKRTGHGHLSAMQALAQSCNIPFFEAGKKIDINLLASYANTFGLGKKTNVMFTEKEGLIPTRQWKLKTKRERWWQGETLSAAIGQSYILVTPIQIAAMLCSIFTGYLAKPRILESEEIIKQPLSIKRSTLAFLRKSMRWVVTQGTGRRVNRIKDIEIYAKTSTTQTSRFEKRQMGKQFMEHGWLGAYFRYKKTKPLTFVVILENVGSSAVATGVARDFLIEYKKLIDERIALGSNQVAISNDLEDEVDD